MLVESTCSSLRLMESNIINQITCSDMELAQPIPYHYLPTNCGHFFTYYYPKNIQEKKYGNFCKYI